MEIFNALKKPFTNLKKLGIGLILNLIPIVNFLSFGYVLECSGVGVNKPSNKLPEWKDWSELFIKGLLATIISIIYYIPIFILSKIFVSALEITYGSSEMVSMAYLQHLIDNLAILMPALILISIVNLIISYLLPAALLNYLKHRSFSQAFKFNIIFKKVFNRKYFIAWLIFTILGVFLAWLTMLISHFFLFWLILSTGIFIKYIIGFTLFGEAFRKV